MSTVSFVMTDQCISKVYSTAPCCKQWLTLRSKPANLFCEFSGIYSFSMPTIRNFLLLSLNTYNIYFTIPRRVEGRVNRVHIEGRPAKHHICSSVWQNTLTTSYKVLQNEI